MLKLKIETSFNACNCELISSDKTGFSQDGGLDGGFIPEGNVLLTNKDYHLSDGVFVKSIHRLDYSTLCLENLKGSDRYISSVIPTNLVDRVNYDNNVTPYLSDINRDGFIYSDTYFVISKAFYDARKNEPGRFDPSLPIIYFNTDTGHFVYLLEDYEEILVTEEIFINTVKNNASLQGVVFSSDSFFNTCNIKNCFKDALEANIDSILGYSTEANRNCLSKDCTKESTADLDLLKNIYITIDYLIECENYLEADRLLSVASSCSGICAKYGGIRGSGCGCR